MIPFTAFSRRARPRRSLLYFLCAAAILIAVRDPESIFSGPDPLPVFYETQGNDSVPADELLMSVSFIDVGQGDSILIESGSSAMLIDAGTGSQGATVADYLNSRGVVSLDYVIGTHPDADHIGGLAQIIDAFDVDQVILPPKEHTTRTFEDLLDAVERNGLSVTSPVPGETYELGYGSFTIAAPVSDYGDDLNDWSVGIRLVCGNRSFLMCGDAEETAETDMVISGLPLDADVLKLNHHGSNTSSCELFLDAVNPSYAVISCGADNSYGHPHREVLERLNARNITVYRTDLLGTVTVSTDGEELIWNFEKGE